MVKSNPNNRAKGARRARRTPRKNIQKQNQKASQPRRGGGVRGMGPLQVPWGTLPGTNTNMGPNTSQHAVIEKDEFVAQFNGSSAFVATQFALNPGLAASFPAGALDAQLWTEWQCDMIEYYTRPLVSGFSTQGQSGKTLLSFDYNALNAAPNSQQQAEIMPHADGMPFENVLLRIDPRCVNRSDSKYVRTGAAPAGSDLKTYDGGNLWLCTYGQGGTAVAGELRVRYRFRMQKATLLNASPASMNAGQKIVSGGATSNAAVYGAAPVSTGVNYATALSQTLTFNQIGQFMVDGHFSGTLSALSVGGTATTTAVFTPTTVNLAGTDAYSQVLVNVTAVGQTMVWSAPTGTVTASQTRISLYTYSLA